MVDRLVSAKTRENEEEIEQTLRPRRLAEYIGQEKLKEHVQIRPPSNARSRSTTCCSTARPVSVRRRLAA